MPEDKEIAVEFDNVTFNVGLRSLVSNLNFSVYQGEALILLGRSGSGKTTTMKLINGLLAPTGGEVRVKGRSTKDWDLINLRRTIGYVIQEIGLFPHFTIARNVGLVPSLEGWNPKKIKARVYELLQLVGLDPVQFSDRYPHELSGGQQQRVALARALAPQPALILLDEPLSNLDVQVRLRLREEVREILKATGTSGIFVTHDQEEALSIADQIAVMRQGRLEQIGTPEEIYSNPASRFVAEFVTQANFLPAQRRGQVWKTEVGCFDVAVSHKTTEVVSLTDTNTGDLMIREEDLILKPAADAPVVIRSRRFLGREYRYCLQTPSGKELHARTTADTALPVGTRVQLAVVEPVKVFPSD